MAEVSRNLVAILLVLVVVVSGFGTWSIISHAQAPSSLPSGDANGVVSLHIQQRSPVLATVGVEVVPRANTGVING